MARNWIVAPQEIKIVVISSVYLTISKKFMLEGEARMLRITRGTELKYLLRIMSAVVSPSLSAMYPSAPST
jgi:hypothetical protein